MMLTAGMTAEAVTAERTWRPMSTAEFSFFTTEDGGRLRHALWRSERPARGTVVLLTGRCEFIERYEELAAEWRDHGFDVVSFDWRGQGLSDRFTDDSGRCHVPDFLAMVDDLGQFLDRVVAPLAHRPTILIAHSMGAAIATKYLARRQDRFEAAILSAPMFDVITDPYPRWFAELIARLASATGFGSAYAWGQRPYDPVLDAVFETNLMTGDPDRFARFHAWYRERPELAIGGVTFGWLAAAFRLSALLAVPGALDQIRLPVLMLSAPDDRLVPPDLHPRLAQRMINCTLRQYPGARHEPFMETDAIRAAVWRDIGSFLRRELDISIK